MIRSLSSLALGLAILLLWGCTPSQNAEDYEIVIQGGRLMDPESGKDALLNLGIRNGRIEAITEGNLAGEEIIDATGLVVAPGFVDLHAHGQSEESFALMVRDGVTCAFELEVGTADVEAWYGERQGQQILHYGVSVGHIPVRMKVMGDSGQFMPSGPGGSEPASQEQLAEMDQLIRQGLAQGAVAVGFGLAYTPAATSHELEAMLRIVQAHGASAHIHVRSNPEGVKEALQAAANTGAALHILHINSSGGPETPRFLETIDRARSAGQDVTTEAYPYEAGMTMIESALFDDWESWDEERFAQHQWAETGERLTRQSFARYRAEGGGVIIHGRSETSTRAAILHPLTMIASDGILKDGRGHPRTSGTYAKVLGKYVREDKVLTLMQALEKMTLQPARRLESYVPAMSRKGRLKVGADADITLFDPETVRDRSTYNDPTLPSRGIPYVLVGGVVVVKNGELVPGVRPGRPVRNPG